MIDLAKKWCPQEAAKFLTDDQFIGGWVSSFAEARQVSFTEAKNDVCIWIDADDTLHGGEELRKGIDHYFGEKDMAALFLRYDYAHDSTDEACTTVLYRERALRKSEFFWKGRCHEVLIPTKGLESLQDRLVKVEVPEIFIKHEPRFKKKPGFSDLRNYVILRKEFEESPNDVDPRTLYYLANACRGLKRFKESIFWNQQLVGRSGSADDRHSAAMNTAICYAQEQRYWAMLQWANKAIQIKPFEATGYFLVARAYYHMRRFRECLFWTEVGRQLPDKTDSLHSSDPQAFTFYPGFFALESHKELGNFREAIMEGERLCQLRPNLKIAADHLAHLKQWAGRRRAAEAVRETLQLAPTRDVALEITQKIKTPEILEHYGLGKLERKVYDKGRATVSLFCGRTFEDWGPESLKTGIGGSERMVIELGRRLQKSGLAVTVYANIPENQRKIDEHGVSWQHYSSLNIKLKRDYMVCWRAPEGIEAPIPVRKRYLWMHDVSSNNKFTPARVELLDKLIIMSKFHRDCFPAVPDSKVYHSRNGIDSKLIAKYLKKTKRDPKRIIYCSSPERGLVHALRAFSLAHSKDPELKFDIYYGFTPYYYEAAAQIEYSYIPTQNRTRHLLEYAEEIFQMVDEIPNCTIKGRIPCHQMSKEMAASGIWLYPASFAEISCMAAMEAQAAGMCSVASNVAALAETIDWSKEINILAHPDEPIEQIAEKILVASRVPAEHELREQNSEAALKRFDFDALAEAWVRDLFV
jgi:glycosyltransferase involved in cell wall biosynthesis